MYAKVVLLLPKEVVTHWGKLGEKQEKITGILHLDIWGSFLNRKTKLNSISIEASPY